MNAGLTGEMDVAGLVEWLNAQLDQDEQRARSHHRLVRLDQPPPFGPSFPPVVFKPDQELAAIEVTRALLDRASQVIGLGQANRDSGEDEPAQPYQDAILLLAQPYAGRTGWRDEWAV